MSNDELLLNGKGFDPPIDLNQVPVKLGVTALSIRETVRSRIPSDKSRYDRNDKADRLYREWSQSSHAAQDRYETVMHLFYEQYRPKIMAIAKRYRALSPAFDDDDLEQIGLLGIFQALTKYDHAENIDMRFSTYLEWSIRNLFQRTIGYTDKFVEIYGRNDDFTCVVSYREFLLKKKAIISGGGRYVIRSRQCYLSDVHRLSNSCAPGAHHPGEAAEETEWRDQGDDRSEGASYEG